MSKDYYSILGISKSASADEIRKAYHNLAKKYHPDRHTASSATERHEAEQKLKEINAAYNVLKDAKQRANYDQFGEAGINGQGAAGFSSHGFHAEGFGDVFEMFNNIMGGGQRAQSRTHQPRGSDLKYSLSISLEEAFTGVNKIINFRAHAKCDTCQGRGAKDKSEPVKCPQCNGRGTTVHQQGFFAIEQACRKCNGEGYVIPNPCPTCRGEGRVAKERTLAVNIPAGVESGSRIRLSGEGEAGIRNGHAGDLYIFTQIEPHKVFKLDHINLHYRLPINFTTAALGGELEVPTIEGGKATLKIPAGAQYGERLVIHGKGMPKLKSTVRGDMYVHLQVDIPKKLTENQRQLLEQLDKQFASPVDSGSDESFFTKMKNIWK